MRFDWYFEPETVKECVQLLEEYGPDARLLAGGTDLVVRMRNRQVKPKAVISINSIKELQRIVKEGDGLSIGAMVRLMDVSRSDMLVGPWQVVKQCAGHVSSMQIRNVGTIGGNTCNASPSADTVPGLMVLDTQVAVAGPKGERTLPLDGFFAGPGKTVLQQGEMLTFFKVPAKPKGNGCAFKKYSIRGDTDISIINVGVRLQVGGDKKITDARLVLGGVAPTPLRVQSAEKMLLGQALSCELKKAVAEDAANSCSPISDARATKEYRKEMVRVWVKHTLQEAYDKASCV